MIRAMPIADIDINVAQAAPMIPNLGIRIIFNTRFKRKAPKEFQKTNRVYPDILKIGPAAPRAV